MIGCLAILLPRLTLFCIMLFSDYLGRAYETILWPLLGFFFLPLTTLAYAFGKNHGPDGSISGWYLVLMVIAVLIDLGSAGHGGQSARKR